MKCDVCEEAFYVESGALKTAHAYSHERETV